MSNRLNGKTCIVTGAGQGIGRAIAEAFLSEGGKVVAIDMQKDVLEAWAHPAGAQTAVIDITPPLLPCRAARPRRTPPPAAPSSAAPPW